jgi:hypothetical protein
MASTVTLPGTESANKNFHEKVSMDIVFQRKKQNSNRVRGLGDLSILAKVKNAKMGHFLP